MISKLPKNATLLGKDDNFRNFYFYLKNLYWQKDPPPPSALVAVLVSWKNKGIFYLTFLIHIYMHDLVHVSSI